MDEAKAVSFHYSRSQQYRTFAATGVWGGVMPDGNVLAAFFIDYPQMPTKVSHELVDGVKLGEQKGAEYAQGEGAGMERCLEVGVALSPDKARSIAEWLIRKADEAEELRGVMEARTDGDTGR